jgi:hypothetical protein
VSRTCVLVSAIRFDTICSITVTWLPQQERLVAVWLQITGSDESPVLLPLIVIIV